MSMSTGSQTWVAAGPAGTVGSIHREGESYVVRVLADDDERGPFDTLEAAKRAIHAAMGAGAERPEFTEH